VGHALGGIAAGWLVRGAPVSAPSGWRAWWRDVFVYVVLGLLPDVDLLFGAHSGPTHGLGVALLIVLLVWATKRAGDTQGFALSCGIAYGSHTLLDWLGTDTSAPVGIMALWPLTRTYYDSGLQVFMAVSRRYWQPELFWRQNLLALVRELLILVPLLGIIWRIKGRRGLSP
jgi:inner membrane protein